MPVVTKYFAIVDWEDSTSGVIPLTSILSPRKEFSEYREGENVSARYEGVGYMCRIIKISANKKELEKELDLLILNRTIAEGFHDSPEETTEFTQWTAGSKSSGSKRPKMKSKMPSVAADRKKKLLAELKAFSKAGPLETTTSPKDGPAGSKSCGPLETTTSPKDGPAGSKSCGPLETTTSPKDGPAGSKSCESRPQMGIKRPKKRFLGADCVKCAVLEEKVEELTSEIDILKEAQEAAAPGCSKIEVIPGSGVWVTPAALEEVKRRKTPTAKARHLLNCLLTSDEIIQKGSVSGVGRHLIKTIALFTSKDAEEFSKCKIALRSKITCTLCKYKKGKKAEPGNATPPSYKSPEFIDCDDIESDAE